jgi:uncharacterized Ntn-hydrolase superfamily protein
VSRSAFALLFSLAVPAVRASAQQPLTAPAHLAKLAHTYSIVAWDSATGDLGVAVQSKFPNVGGIVPWARSGVGVVATQSLSNTAYGERGLDLMAEGATAEEALRIVMRTDTMLQDRQVGMVDARGNAASFTGKTTFDWAGGRVGAPGSRGNVPGGKGQVIVGHGFTAQANIMVSDQTVVRKNGGYLGANDRFIDIRVYDAKDPIAELERLLALHKLHFFPSEARDLVPITSAVVAQLEPILLADPAGQPEKWLTKPQGTATPAFLEALKNFMYWENYDVRVRMDGKIDRVVLEDILKKRTHSKDSP